MNAGAVPATRLLLALLAITALELGCAKAIPPGRSAVDTVKIEGNSEISSGDIQDKLATTESSRFLMLFEGVVFDYEVFDRYVLERDLARVERYYRSRGFYEAHARAGRSVTTKSGHVVVTVEVEEGPPTFTRSITIRGVEGLPDDIRAAVTAAATSRIPLNRRFEEQAYVAGEGAVKRALTDNRYAYAKVVRTAHVDLVEHMADIAFDITPDKPARYGKITLEGLGDLPEAPIRRALDLEEGGAYSTADIDSAKQAVLDIGAFSSVEIVGDLPDPVPDEHIVPLTVKVERSRLHRVRLGGGIELDVIKTDVHGLAGWESRNFLGGFRKFTVEFRPGVVLYPTRLPTFQAPTNYLPEEKLRVELRQPGFLEARTGGLVRAEFNIYPVILSPQVDKTVPVVGYREVKASVGVDRSIWKFYVAPSYNIQDNVPFTYLGDRDASLQPIVLSYVQLYATFDYRNDRVHPSKGVFVGNDLQVAGGPFGGSASDVKVQPEARVYVPIVRGLTFAARGTAGFLFPFNYGHATQEAAATGSTPLDVGRDEWVRDSQIVFFRGFFSGGPSSNRGYPLRGVGPHGIVPFFNPGVQSQELALRCNPKDPLYSEARCSLPLGGLSLWEASAELRATVKGPFEVAGFCDTSDVSPTQVNFRFTHPHLSCGAGARYDTPVGPIRLDIGYRIPGLQVLGAHNELTEGNPGTIFGIPIALAFGIGEAFLWTLRMLVWGGRDAPWLSWARSSAVRCCSSAPFSGAR